MFVVKDLQGEGTHGVADTDETTSAEVDGDAGTLTCEEVVQTASVLFPSNLTTGLVMTPLNMMINSQRTSYPHCSSSSLIIAASP